MSHISAAGAATFCPKAQRRYVLVAAILASALGFIDGSVVAIAMPAMRVSLNASLVDAQWISNAYMLMLSAFMLVGGAAGDRFGLRLVFAGGIALFVAASMICAIAPDALSLIAARALQGLGAAFMVPGSLAIISKAFPKEERGRAIGIWAAASAITTAAGPILGGFLLSLGNVELWRLIFAINLPLGGAALYLLLARVPADGALPAKRLDLAGAFFAVVMLGSLVWALTGEGGEGGVPGVRHMLIWLAVAAAGFAGFIMAEKRAAEPIMPLSIFRSAMFSAANIVTFFLYFTLSAVLFFLPMMLIGGWRLPEAQVGFTFLPLTIAIAFMSGPVGKLSDKLGPGVLIAAGSLIVAAAYGGLALGIGVLGLSSFWGHVMPMMALMGFGMGLVVSPLSAAVMGAVSDQETGAASGVNNAVARVAGLVAVAAMGTLAMSLYPAFGAVREAADQLHAAGNARTFAVIAVVTAAMSALAAIIAFFSLRRGGDPA